MLGGRFIDSGQYGCTFIPPLLCQGENPDRISRTDVSKIGLDWRGDLSEELRILLRIRNNIPNAPAYFSVPTTDKLCHASKTQPFNPPFELLRCTHTRSYTVDSPNLWTFRMKFAGSKDNNQGLFSSPDAFWRFGKHLLEGLTLLMVEGLVHGDLHSNNILVDNNYIPRIIDFGFTLDAYNISQRQLNSLSEAEDKKDDPYLLNFTQYPPEQSLFRAADAGVDPSTLIDRFFRTPRRTRTLTPIMEIYGKTEASLKKEMLEFTQQSISFRQRDFKLFWKNNWHKYDSYAAGHILLQKLYHLMKSGLEGRDTKHIEQIKKTILGLCNLNPLKRLSPAEALAIWDSPQNEILVKYAQKWL